MRSWFRRARSRANFLAGGLLFATCSALLIGSSAPAGAGTILLADDFTGGTVTSNQYVVGGSGFTPCLTSAGSGTSTPGRCTPTIDSSGNGALRLTAANKVQAGFLLYDNALPTKAGLDISFDMYQYGGTGADGISFFLTDGASSLTTPGPNGGSLGYQYNGSTLGLAHALIGVGLDAFGNYSVEWNDPACPIQRPQATPYAQEIAVRGPGGANRTSGYCLLAPPVHATGIDDPTATTRSASKRVVRIVVDPPTNPNPKITVFLDGVQETQVPEPAVMATTPTFKFGWAASTGGSTDVHEINFVRVASVNPIAPELSVTATPSVSIPSGGTATVVATPTVTSPGGPEPAPVTLTFTAPVGASFAGSPTGAGWVCAPPTGQTATCSYTPTDPITPGTVLPPVTARVTCADSGTFGVTSSVSSSDDPATGSQLAATTAVTVTPVATTTTTTTTTTSTTTTTTPQDAMVILPTTTPSTPGTPSTTPAAPDPAKAARPSSPPRELAFTGTDPMPALVTALLLLAAGASAVRGSRHRRDRR